MLSTARVVAIWYGNDGERILMPKAKCLKVREVNFIKRRQEAPGGLGGRAVFGSREQGRWVEEKVEGEEVETQ